MKAPIRKPLWTALSLLAVIVDENNIPHRSTDPDQAGKTVGLAGFISRATLLVLLACIQFMASPVFAKGPSAPPLKRGELVIITKDGCGLIYKQRGDQYDQYEIKRIKATNWGGTCIDGLAMGRGRFYEEGAVPGGSNKEIYAWAWYGRVFGAMDWSYLDGGANHAYYWDHKIVTYTSLDSTKGVWNKGLGQDSVVNDGSKMVRTNTDPYSVEVLDFNPPKFRRYGCSNPDSAEGCDVIWKENAGPVIARIKSFIATNKPKVAARLKQTEILVASAKSRLQKCGNSGTNKGCGTGQPSAAMQQARLKTQEEALARAKGQERAATEKREREQAEQQKKFKEEMAAMHAQQQREREAYEREQRAREAKGINEALKQFAETVKTVNENERKREEERRQEEEERRQEQERRRMAQEEENRRYEAMQAQEEAERSRREYEAESRARMQQANAERSPKAPPTGTVINSSPQDSQRAPSPESPPMGHIETGRRPGQPAVPILDYRDKPTAAQTRTREREYQEQLKRAREDELRTRQAREVEANQRKQAERVAADQKTERLRRWFDREANRSDAVTVSIEEAGCPRYVVFTNHTKIDMSYVWEYTMISQDESYSNQMDSFTNRMHGKLGPQQRMRLFLAAQPPLCRIKWRVPSGHRVTWQPLHDYSVYRYSFER